jgi:hypothetical protein
LLFDALITAHARDGGLERVTQSTRAGQFTLPFLPPGTYDLLIERVGFRPRRVRAVPVRAGGIVDVPVVLSAITGSDGSPDSETYARPLSGHVPGLVTRVPTSDDLPDEHRDLLELTRRASLLELDGGGEGLPASMGGVFWDGVQVFGARHPSVAGSEDWGAIPLHAVSAADLMANGLDVEWGGVPGPFVSTYSTRGTHSLHAHVTAISRVMRCPIRGTSTPAPCPARAFAPARSSPAR